MKLEKILRHIENKKNAIQNNYETIARLNTLPDCDLKETKLAEEKELLMANKTRLAELEKMI